MTLDHFIEIVSIKRGWTKKGTREWLDAFTTEIERAVLDDNDKLAIPKFGTFKQRRSKGGTMPTGKRFGKRIRLAFVASSHTKAIYP